MIQTLSCLARQTDEALSVFALFVQPSLLFEQACLFWFSYPDYICLASLFSSRIYYCFNLEFIFLKKVLISFLLSF